MVKTMTSQGLQSCDERLERHDCYTPFTSHDSSISAPAAAALSRGRGAASSLHLPHVTSSDGMPDSSKNHMVVYRLQATSTAVLHSCTAVTVFPPSALRPVTHRRHTQSRECLLVLVDGRSSPLVVALYAFAQCARGHVLDMVVYTLYSCTMRSDRLCLCVVYSCSLRPIGYAHSVCLDASRVSLLETSPCPRERCLDRGAVYSRPRCFTR